MAEFPWASAQPEHSHAYLLPTVLEVLRRRLKDGAGRRVLDMGSGNGAMTAAIAKAGFPIMGVDPSTEGIEQARANYGGIRFEQADGYGDLAGRFGTFDAVVTCEVVEHLLTPGVFMRRLRELLNPGGFIVMSTPYHGYLKNVLLALAGKWDFHHHPEREWGHVKFFSRDSLNRLAATASLREAEFHRVGRVPPIAKSMISVFEAA